MSVKKITAVLLAEEVEPCVKFWMERLGFEKTAEVPDSESGKLVFAMLQKGGAEIMYQSYASVERDDPHAGPLARKGPTFLYIEVDDLAQTMAATAGAEVTMPERTTFYGAREFGVKDPAGHFLTFAQFGA
jgi:uncharacterized glyoxalase superfamily protein PhnB